MGLRQTLVGLAIMAAIAGALYGGAKLYHRFFVAKPLGGDCRRNEDCRTGRCLVGRSAALPGMASGGSCTITCAGDPDCPATMRCGQATASSTVGGILLSGKGEPVTVCLPR